MNEKKQILIISLIMILVGIFLLNQDSSYPFSNSIFSNNRPTFTPLAFIILGAILLFNLIKFRNKDY
jgi:L-lactate permease